MVGRIGGPKRLGPGAWRVENVTAYFGEHLFPDVGGIGKAKGSGFVSAASEEHPARRRW